MVEKCFGSWIIKDCIEIQVKEKKVVVLCCRSQQNAVKLGRFTPSSGTDGKEMYKKAWRRVVVFILNLLLFAAFFLSPSSFLVSSLISFQEVTILLVISNKHLPWDKTNESSGGEITCRRTSCSYRVRYSLLGSKQSFTPWYYKPIHRVPHLLSRESFKDEIDQFQRYPETSGFLISGWSSPGGRYFIYDSYSVPRYRFSISRYTIAIMYEVPTLLTTTRWPNSPRTLGTRLEINWQWRRYFTGSSTVMATVTYPQMSYFTWFATAVRNWAERRQKNLSACLTKMQMDSSPGRSL